MSAIENVEETEFEEIASRLLKVGAEIAKIESGEKKYANNEKILSYLRFLSSVLEAAAIGSENAVAMLSEESYAKNSTKGKDETKTESIFSHITDRLPGLSLSET